MQPKSEQTENKPGADRFWGQFSQSRAGRSNAGDPADDSSHEENGNPAGAGPENHCLEWCPICRSAELFRNTVSPELSKQAESIQHEALGVLKAFLDAYSEKAGSEHGGASGSNGTDPGSSEPEEPPAPRVTDIPLD